MRNVHFSRFIAMVAGCAMLVSSVGAFGIEVDPINADAITSPLSYDLFFTGYVSTMMSLAVQCVSDGTTLPVPLQKVPSPPQPLPISPAPALQATDASSLLVSNSAASGSAPVSVISGAKGSQIPDADAQLPMAGWHLVIMVALFLIILLPLMAVDEYASIINAICYGLAYRSQAFFISWGAYV